MQIYVCVICKVNRPPMFVLSFEHRQVFEAVVSSAVDITKLKTCRLLACTDCQQLLQTVVWFQQTALVGARHLLSLMPSVQQTPQQVEIETHSEIKKDVKVEFETHSEVIKDVKVEPDADDPLAIASSGSDIEEHMAVYSIKKEVAPPRAQNMTAPVATRVVEVDRPPGQLATALHMHDNRLAPFMHQHLVPAGGQGRGGAPAGMGDAPLGRGGAAAGRGGSTAEWGGTAMGRGGAAAGSGGAASGWVGAAAEWGAAAIGRGGPAAGRGFAPAGMGGPAAGSGRAAVGRGGTAMGRGGAAMGRGGAVIGRGGPAAGRGNSAAWSDLKHATLANLLQKTAKLPSFPPIPSPDNSNATADKPADTQAHTQPGPSARSSKPWDVIVLKESEIEAERDAARKSAEYAEAEFRCEPCARAFGSAALAEAHAQLHQASAGAFTCHICTQRMSSIKELSAHRSRHAVRYHCRRCAYSTPHKQMVEIHTCDPEQRQDATSARYHNGRRRYRYPKPVKCKHCFAGFSHEVALAEHTNKHHTEPPVPAKCEECGKMFKSKYFLKRHSYKHKHKGLESLRPELFCAECKMSFPSQSSYRNHRSSLKHSNKDDWKYECDYCGRKCPNKSAIDIHIKAVHTMDRKFKCEQCPKAFVTRGHLRRHAPAHAPASRPRPHVCDQCGKAFMDKATLRQHINSHNGLRPYACKLCPATFSFSGAVYTHTKLKHHKMKKECKKKGRKKKAEEKEVESLDSEKLDEV